MLPLFGILAGAQLGEGLFSMFKGQSDLRELHKKPFPLESETPEMRASRMRAEEMAKGGFTSAETGAYQQQLSRSQNTGYTRSLDVAPGMSQAVLAGQNYTNVGAIGDFASRDANLHRSNIQYADKFSQQLQAMAGRNIAEQQQNRRQAEAALGQGIAASRDRAFGAGNTLIASLGYDQQQKQNKLLEGLLGGKPGANTSASPFNPGAIPAAGAVSPIIPPTDYSNPYGAPRERPSTTQPPYSDQFFDYSLLTGIPRN